MYLLDTDVVAELRKTRPHGGLVVTRNVRDFKSFDVPVLDPFTRAK